MARYVSKEFLSPCADETGSIVCQIETPLVTQISEYTVRDGGWMHASVKVSDCSKTVTLDFDCSSDSAYEKRVAKLDKMIEELQNMRHQFTHMWDNMKRNVAHKERLLAEEKADKLAEEELRRVNYRGRV